MYAFIARRLFVALPTLLLMLTAVFVLVRLVPGDPAIAILGDQASQEALEQLRAKLGLNQSLVQQYFAFLGDMLTGKFGVSLSTGKTVLSEVIVVLPHTLELAAASLILGSLIGIPMGVVAAIYSGKWPDYLGRLISLIGLSFPAFVSGILLLLYFAIHHRWFPVIGTGSAQSGGRLYYLALPALNLGLIMAAYIARVMRSSMLAVLGEDYIRTARAKGLQPYPVILRHALRNSLIPVITVIGLYFGSLVGNSVLTEMVFSRPGLGKLILGALNSRDYSLLQGLMVVFATIVIIVNILTDIAYALVDPRVKLS